MIIADDDICCVCFKKVEGVIAFEDFLSEGKCCLFSKVRTYFNGGELEISCSRCGSVSVPAAGYHHYHKGPIETYVMCKECEK